MFSIANGSVIKMSQMVTSERLIRIMSGISHRNGFFNDCILGKSDQVANPIIVMVNPVPYYSIRAHLCL